MEKKSKDLRNTEEKQSDTANPTEQNNKDNTANNKAKPPNPLLGQKAEEYLREQANIEDMPSEKDQEDYDKTIEENEK